MEGWLFALLSFSARAFLCYLLMFVFHECYQLSIRGFTFLLWCCLFWCPFLRFLLSGSQASVRCPHLSQIEQGLGCQSYTTCCRISSSRTLSLTSETICSVWLSSTMNAWCSILVLWMVAEFASKGFPNLLVILLSTAGVQYCNASPGNLIQPGTSVKTFLPNFIPISYFFSSNAYQTRNSEVVQGYG